MRHQRELSSVRFKNITRPVSLRMDVGEVNDVEDDPQSFEMLQVVRNHGTFVTVPTYTEYNTSSTSR